MKEIIDQLLHFLLGFFASFPVIGGLFAGWCREFYQAKERIPYEPDFSEVVSKINFLKPDLLFGYAGVLAFIGSGIWLWILLS